MQIRGEGDAETTTANLRDDALQEYLAGGKHYTWDKVVGDFLLALRSGDVAHRTVPDLPTLADGLEAQKVVYAARLSDRDNRWVRIEEMDALIGV